MSKIAAISGGLGDAVYSIPALKRLDVSILYIKENFYHPPMGSMYTALKPLIECQGIECRPTSGSYTKFEEYEPGLVFDYDMDRARRQPYRGINHIIRSFFAEFHLPLTNWKDPWLTVPAGDWIPDGEYSLIHLTPRWRDRSPVNWKAVLFNIPRPVYFIGFLQEWQNFACQYGDVTWLPTNNLLEVAQAIQGAQALYCNQSVALTIAQGLGKPYALERKPGKTNTLLKTPNETIL